MKFLFVFTLLVIAAQGEVSDVFKEIGKQYEKYSTECFEQSKANEDDMKEISAKKSPTRQEGKCFLACLNEKVGVQDEDGKINNEGAMKLLAPLKEADAALYDKMMEMTAKCMPDVENVKDKCEKAAKMNECGHKMVEELGIKSD